MKNNYLKTLTFILIGFISFSITTTDVSAGKCNGKDLKEGQLCAKITQHTTTPDISTKLANTHIMTFRLAGESDDDQKSAYCAWYENDAPESGWYTFSPIEFDNPAVAAGVYSILSTKLDFSKLKDGSADDDDYDYAVNHAERVIKTTAINLFLSIQDELAGKTCTTDPNRFDGRDWQSSEFYNKEKTNPYNIYMGLADSTTKGYKYDKMVASLVLEANKIAGYTDSVGHYHKPTYVQPTITLKNDDSEYILKRNNYYEKKYEFITKGVNKESITVELEGLTEEEKKRVDYSIDKSKKTITVKMPKDLYEGLNNRKITVVINAEAEYGEAKIYVIDTSKRCSIQDLVFPTYELNKKKVSTKDIIKFKKCYRYVTKCDATTCGNLPTERKCNAYVEEYPAITCDANDIGVNTDGKRTYESGPCTLYCKETATVKYPGNYISAVDVYGNFSWPSKEGFYSLKTTSKLTCKMSSKACKLQTKDIKYVNNKGGKLTYTGPKNQKTTILLEQNCQTTEPIIDENNMTLEITSNCSYTLPESKNIGVDKKTLKYVDLEKINQEANVHNNVFLKNYRGVISIDGISTWNDALISSIDFSKKYDLKISELPVGHNGQFTSTLDKSDYVCNYKLTTDVSGKCVCPPESKKAGYDLYKEQAANGYTCADAQSKFCDNNSDDPWCEDKDTKEKKYYKNCSIAVDSPDFTLEKCQKELNCLGDDDGDKFCPPESKFPGKDYSQCVSNGMKEKDCIELICNDPPPCGENCEYSCPENTVYYGMDITKCVDSERAKGKKLNDAIGLCQKKYCDKGNGKIIYRTISLENPFPSMDADKQTTQGGLLMGMFNDSVLGRYPGANWNSETLVKNKILNNRGYDGSAIYQEADPLYVIELDATAIKNIRDYNSYQVEHSEGYADFTLTCTNGAYCRSSFLRDGRYTKADGVQILTGGTCQSVDGKEDFVNCYWYKTKKG